MSEQLTYREAMRRARREYLRKVLAEAGSMRRAAKIAGVDRPNLYRMKAKWLG